MCFVPKTGFHGREKPTPLSVQDKKDPGFQCTPVFQLNTCICLGSSRVCVGALEFYMRCFCEPAHACIHMPCFLLNAVFRFEGICMCDMCVLICTHIYAPVCACLYMHILTNTHVILLLCGSMHLCMHAPTSCKMPSPSSPSFSSPSSFSSPAKPNKRWKESVRARTSKNTPRLFFSSTAGDSAAGDACT